MQMPLITPQKTSSVAKDLTRLLGAQKVLHDAPSLTAYAVDASIYKITPGPMAEPVRLVPAALGVTGIPVRPA